MRFIKLAAISLIIIFLLFTCIGLLMPSSVTVGRSEKINAPVDSVRIYTNNLSNWKYWLSNNDTGNFKQLTPATTLVNAKIKLGNYSITIIKNDSDYISTKWQNESENDQFSNIQLHYVNDAAQTEVTWSFTQHISWYPWERLNGMLYDKIEGPQMEAGLIKLKQLVEKN